MIEAVLSLPLSEKDVQRFWLKVDKKEPNECWNWISGLYPSGYGSFFACKKKHGAHRISFLIHNGQFPQGKTFALHKCDNRRCVNPDHLFAGNQADNIRDMHSKNRQAKGDRHGSVAKPGRLPCGDAHYLRMHPERRKFGCANPASRLRMDQVEYIRNQYAAGRSQQSLAEEFGYTQSGIGKIVRRKSYSYGVSESLMEYRNYSAAPHFGDTPQRHTPPSELKTRWTRNSQAGEDQEHDSEGH